MLRGSLYVGHVHLQHGAFLVRPAASRSYGETNSPLPVAAPPFPFSLEFHSYLFPPPPPSIKPPALTLPPPTYAFSRPRLPASPLAPLPQFVRFFFLILRKDQSSPAGNQPRSFPKLEGRQGIPHMLTKKLPPCPPSQNS